MTINATDAQNGNALRTKRAQWEGMAYSVARPEEEDGPGIVNVANHSHDNPAEHTYSVTVRDGKAVSCTCPDHQYRDNHCKHQRAVAATEPVMMAVSGRVRADGGTVEDSDESGIQADCEDCGDDLPCFAHFQLE